MSPFVHSLADAFAAMALVAAGSVVPGLLCVRPFFPGVSLRASAFRFVLAFVLGYAGFTVAADFLARYLGSNVYTLLVLPPAVTGLAGWAAARLSRRRPPTPLADGLDLSWRQLGGSAAFALLIVAQVYPVETADGIYWGQPYSDHVKHTYVTNAVARTGCPPMNPTYAPFGDKPLFYYYGFYLWPGAAARVFGAGAVPPVMACTFLVATSFLATTVALGNYLHGTLRGGWAALALCGVTGLDLIPLAALEATGLQQGDFEWWNPGQVMAVTGLLVWVPQHAMASVYVLTALLLTVAAAKAGWRDPRAMAVSVLVAACGMTSTYVAEVLVGTLAVQIFLGAASRRWSEAVGPTLMVLGGGLLLIVPFYLHLASVDEYVGPSVRLVFRPFRYDYELGGLMPFAWFDRFQPYFGGYQAYRVVAMPLQYAIEFGLWAWVGTVWVRWGVRGERGGSLLTGLGVMSVVALGLGSVPVSVRLMPDLNWRVLHPVQGVLPAVGAAILLRMASAWSAVPFVTRTGVLTALYLGLAGSIYDFYLMRFPARSDWVASPQLAKRARDGVAAIQVVVGPSSRVEYNPDQVNGPWLVYLNRPVAISDRFWNSATFGVDRKEHKITYDTVKELFRPSISVTTKSEITTRYKLDYLILQTEDLLYDLDDILHAEREFRVALTGPGWVLLECIRRK